jgi:hypothetical protein
MQRLREALRRWGLWLPVMLSSPNERSGKRRRSDRTALRSDGATAADDASPIARRSRGSGPAREAGEGYSESRQARQRRKARRRCLAVRGLVRLSVEEPLALCGGEQGGCPFPVVHVARVGAEIELGKVAMQMRLADVVERPEHTAFQQREMAFDRIGMMKAARLDVFLGGMVDAAVTCEFGADRRIKFKHVEGFGIDAETWDEKQV